MENALRTPGGLTKAWLLADDLSGALEAGAAFRERGWPVSVPLTASAKAGPEGEIRVISTETRNSLPAAAAGTVRRVIAAERAAGARLVFKKIDSTLRGPLGAELLAVIAELEPALVVLGPANPRAGRTVRGGVLHVDGVPLPQTAFRDDPEWPATTGCIATLLAAQGVTGVTRLPLAELRADAVRVLRRLASKSPRTVLVADAETEGDLARVVEAAQAVAPDTIFVGSGALGIAVAQCAEAPVVSAEPERVAVSAILVLCGSRHPASHRQLEQLARSGLPVLTTSLEDGIDPLVDAIAAAAGRHRVVAVRFDRAEAVEAPRALVERLAAIAAAAPCRRIFDTLFLTGGETAALVCRALGAGCLELVRELEAGVVLSRMRTAAAAECWVVTKPGGFGDAETIARSVRSLLR